MIQTVIAKARAWMPESVKGAIASCGGWDPRGHRFAGHLARPDLTEKEFLGVCDALILPNGTRKTTGPARNAILIRKLLDRGLLGKPRTALDVGASAGLDALTTVELLSTVTTIDEYVLGDLHTAVLYDRERGLVFDEDGNLLQVARGRGYVAMHFSYAFDFQRVTHAPKKVRPFLMRKTGADRLAPNGAVERLPIVHPRMKLGPPGPFRLRRMDVFAPVEGRFDLVICLHLLVSRYFSAAKIREGEENLARALNVGGTLLVGSREDFRLIKRVSEDDYETTRSETLDIGPVTE
ncbi:MAG: hypothetical protein QM702_21485 [Rubrivivax sp.]